MVSTSALLKGVGCQIVTLGPDVLATRLLGPFGLSSPDCLMWGLLLDNGGQGWLSIGLETVSQQSYMPRKKAVEACKS